MPVTTNGKGKAPELSTKAPALQEGAGSANPAASLSSLWVYLQPALDHIMRSPTNDDSKAPSLDVAYHMGIHTAAYNYFTSQANEIPTVVRQQDKDKVLASGADLYGQLDKYMSDTARELLLGAPQDDSTLIHYIIPCFNRYAAGAQSVNRLLNYVNRHYVKRAVDEDKGWLRLADVIESVAKTIKVDDTREKISARMKEKRGDELKKWGYEEGGSGELAAKAEACAEAASAPDRIVPLASLALRRFRVEFIEPLLAVPKVKARAKMKNKIPIRNEGPSGPPGPKGRLARAVKELLEGEGVEKGEKLRLATELAKALRWMGVRPDHTLRKKLDKYVTTCAVK